MLTLLLKIKIKALYLENVEDIQRCAESLSSCKKSRFILEYEHCVKKLNGDIFD